MCHQGIRVCVESLGMIETHRKILVLLKSNFEVESTSHDKELIAFQYHMILDCDKKKLMSIPYYQPHESSP